MKSRNSTPTLLYYKSLPGSGHGLCIIVESFTCKERTEKSESVLEEEETSMKVGVPVTNYSSSPPLEKVELPTRRKGKISNERDSETNGNLISIP